MKICTINLFNYVAPPNAFYDFANIYTKEEWQIKTQWLERSLVEIDADIIGFQEVFSIDVLRSSLEALGYPYFVTIDTPDIEQDYIYSNPVLALASRYPILETPVINLESPIAQQQADFQFSRQPIHAVINIPKLGALDVYVVHFKSQRPVEFESLNLLSKEKNQSASQTADEASLSTTERWLLESQGKWLSTIQRGMEAHALHHHVINTKNHSKRPCVIMGDFNQSLQSNEFHCLTSKQLFRQNETLEALSEFHLHNSRDLSMNEEDRKSNATYYVGAQAKELDYILLSNEFSSYSSHTHTMVNRYEVKDSHLTNPRYGVDHVSSDHGIVIVDISII
nr:endonuclease/exonuclease/phosphatase family protein [Vibrio amylolyticus]